MYMVSCIYEVRLLSLVKYMVLTWLGQHLFEHHVAQQDTNDSQLKRDAYYNARTHPYYVMYGPNASPKIPVTG